MDVNAKLTEARDALVTALVTACTNAKPNYSLDGQSVSWGDYMKMLKDGIKEITELLAYFDTVEVRTQIL